MKTKNNTQKTVFTHVSKVVLYTSVVIFSVLFLAMTASAQRLWNQLSNTSSYGKMASLMVDQSSETEKTDVVFENINGEVSTMEVEPVTTDEPSLNSNARAMEEALEYKPEIFVEAEIAIEKESLMNGNEAIEAESAHQIEVLMNESQYNAGKFVEAEMELEVENEMANKEFIESAETSTANEADQEIAKYAQKVIDATESTPDPEVSNADFFKAAEVYTAKSTEQEIEKYAQKVIDQDSLIASK